MSALSPWYVGLSTPIPTGATLEFCIGCENTPHPEVTATGTIIQLLDCSTVISSSNPSSLTQAYDAAISYEDAFGDYT